MKTIKAGVVLFLGAVAAVCGQESAQSQLHLYPAEPWNTNMTHQVVWETVPGVRYELQESGSLASATNWAAVPGWPAEAAQHAQAYAFNAAADPADARFFKVVAFDEQPPAVSDRVPDDGAFAIPRFGTISLKLSDVSGVDEASISLSVGSLGTFTVSDPQLSFADGVLVFDNGGDTALGYYGTNVQVSLVAADVNGYAMTNAWEFGLEVEAVVAQNLFVFGSPEAQRSGQEIGNIPTRVLAERAAGGPIRMSGADPWELQEVVTNGLIIAYTGATAPPFNTGAYLANLTPATVDEIFYRRITGKYDDAANKLLILFTQDVLLTDIVSEGTTSITEDSMILEVSTNGTITKALSFDYTKMLPRIGYSLDGEVFNVYDGPSAAMNVTAEECHFWLTPRLETSLEIKLSGLERFSAIAYGDIDSALVCSIDAHGDKTINETIYDLPKNLEPSTFVTLGSIAGVPIVAKVGVDIKVDADLDSHADLHFRYGFRQDIASSFGVRYENEEVEWVKTFTPAPTDVVPFNSVINGELTAGLTLRPTVYILVYAAAGIETGPAIRGGVRFELEDTQLAGYLEGNADWEISLAGPAFDFLDPLPGLSFNIWGPEEWKLFPAAANLVFTAHPGNVMADYGASATFSCSASSSQSISYQWFQNNTPLYGKTSRTLTLSPLAYSHAGSYMVRATSGGETKYSNTASLTVVEPNSSIFSMKRIPGGTNSGTDPDFGAYSLTVSTFYMDKTEITKAQWDTVYNWAIARGYTFDNAGSGKGSNHPVHTVNWYDVVKWCNARSQMEGKTPVYSVPGQSVYRTGRPATHTDVVQNTSASGYRLPTSTEWEYAARGGYASRRFPWGDTITHSRANYYSSSSYSYDTSSTRGYHPTYATGSTPYTAPVGSFSANGYGLYDMTGNVWEWCWDSSGSNRYFRGGGWYYLAYFLRCGFAFWFFPVFAIDFSGFRAVCR